MYERIDAHLHISSPAMLDVTDPVTGSVMRRSGCIELPDGFIVTTMPFYFVDAGFTAEMIVAAMDQCGVARAVIQQGQFIDRTRFVLEALRQYPDRFRGAMLPDLRDEAACVASLERFRAQGLGSVKLEMNALGKLKPDFHFGLPIFDRLCAACAELGLPVTIDPGPIVGPAYRVEDLAAAADRHPKLKLVICHLGFPRPAPDSDPALRKRWREMIALGQRDNIYFDCAAMPDFFDQEGWPFPTALRMAREYMDLCGPGKLIWGSDLPGSMDHATYPQMIRMYEESGLFSEDELRMLFHDTAEKVYFS